MRCEDPLSQFCFSVAISAAMVTSAKAASVLMWRLEYPRCAWDRVERDPEAVGQRDPWGALMGWHALISSTGR